MNPNNKHAPPVNHLNKNSTHSSIPGIKRNELGYFEATHKPEAAELRKYYAENYFQTGQGNYKVKYGQEELQYIQTKLKQRSAAVRTAGLTTTGSMLDVGCGEGFALSHFSNQGWQVEGLDYSIAGIEAINPSFTSFVSIGDVMSLLEQRIQDGSKYDLVWLSNVLEHSLDPPALLTSLRRIVASTGCLVVTVPNDFSQLQTQLLAKGMIQDAFWINLPDHLAYFDRDSIRRVSEATGWDCAYLLADFPIDWYLLNQASNYVRDRRLGSTAHSARIMLENLLATEPIDKINAFYAAMAELGQGRQITAYLRPKI
ncbi:class I SAM-dependent methyltransferase [Zhongshania sp.]|uniref:class I SAM-dependent methyltransferase n=1 Tax=Zhongshania sp. TaxID=1971902 RepID=UPI001B3FA08C|nr:class I SAM-dependent methyltransferase [Zhongshania sp.]MBQ0797311.1 class I SAM-dependent methyltransferase [Zhongshania sp.]